MQRRHFLRAVAAGGALALAGCSENATGGTTTAQPDAGSGSNPFGGGESEDVGNGGAGGGGTTPTPAPTPTPAATPDPTTTTQTVEWTATPSPASPRLGDLSVEFADNYRFSMDFSNYDAAAGNIRMVGEYHGQNFHNRASYDGDIVDVWLVGGTQYFATDGYCTPVSGSGGMGLPDVDADDWADTEESKRRLEGWADVTASGEATIDGEAMWRFAVTAGERGNEWDYTYYLSKETGYLRRLETQGIVIEYWDWGNVGPIGAPC